MSREASREEGLVRLTGGNISKRNQHYIIYYYLKNDIRNAADKYAKGRLLDIGCGNKPYLDFFTQLKEYIGCDVVQSNESRVDFICPANQLCFENSSFDTVFSTQVIEHVADSRGMVLEAYRVLKNDGYAIFTAPFCWELHEEPYDFFRFSKHGLKDIFQNAGFEIIEIKSNGGKWASIFQLGLNILFSTRKHRTFRSRLISLLFVKLRFIYFYNKLAIWIDKKYFDDMLTLNYLIIARKTKQH